MSAHAVTRAYPKNAIIVNEGDQADNLYIILEGSVKAFVSDADGKIGKAYGALTALRFGFSKRLLFVVGPDGKVTYKATPFRQSSDEAYKELAQAIDKVAPK